MRVTQPRRSTSGHRGGNCASQGTDSGGVAVATADVSLHCASLNFGVVTPGVLWRGGQPDDAGVTWLITNRARTIVNLELVHDDVPAFKRIRCDDSINHQIGYFRIREWEPLPLLASFIVDEHIAYFLAIVATQPRPVFVHCRAGRNRTGVMVAAYRILIEGLPVEDAIVELKRFHGAWAKVGAHYLRGLTLHRRAAIMLRASEWQAKLDPTAQIVCTNGRCTVTPN